MLMKVLVSKAIVIVLIVAVTAPALLVADTTTTAQSQLGTTSSTTTPGGAVTALVTQWRIVLDLNKDGDLLTYLKAMNPQIATAAAQNPQILANLRSTLNYRWVIVEGVNATVYIVGGSPTDFQALLMIKEMPVYFTIGVGFFASITRPDKKVVLLTPGAELGKNQLSPSAYQLTKYPPATSVTPLLGLPPCNNTGYGCVMNGTWYLSLFRFFNYSVHNDPGAASVALSQLGGPSMNPENDSAMVFLDGGKLLRGGYTLTVRVMVRLPSNETPSKYLSILGVAVPGAMTEPPPTSPPIWGTLIPVGAASLAAGVLAGMLIKRRRR